MNHTVTCIAVKLSPISKDEVISFNAVEIPKESFTSILEIAW